MLEPLFDPSLIAPETVRPLSVDEYQRLVEAGDFEDERVELLHGVLVALSPQGDAHADVTTAIVKRLTLALGAPYDVRGHSPFQVGTRSMPEPDVAVVRHRPIGSATPTVALLVVEVADTSLRKDRSIKAGLYAAAGVPEYWIVDLNARVVEVHTAPSGSGYQQREVLRPGELLRPISFPDVALPVTELLPP